MLSKGQLQRSWERVRAAFRADALRLDKPRRRATERACLDKAWWEAALRPSRRNAFKRAWERRREVFSPRWPLRYAAAALLRVRAEV